MLVDTKIIAEMLHTKANELNEVYCYHLEHNAIMGGPSHDYLQHRARALEDMAVVIEALNIECSDETDEDGRCPSCGIIV